MCNHCEHKDPYSEDWKKWDGKTEIKEIWTDKDGHTHHVTEHSPAPSGVKTEWSLYGHSAIGGVFWIADFPVSAHSAAVSLAHRLERAYADSKEIERLIECLENPVGYVNQAVLADLRENEGSHVGSATISRHPDSHHNCAIYAQD